MHIYVVLEGGDHDGLYGTVGAFFDRDKAIAFMKEIEEKHNYYFYSIEETELIDYEEPK